LLIGKNVPPAPEPDGFVEDGEVIEVGAIRLEVLFTPGHSPGHVSYVLREHRIVFSGDCLFAGSIGRTDLPGADQETLLRSICRKLVPLGDDYTVAAGHEELTTIGRERTTNPFVLQWSEHVQR
jgi:glyoxylase-like metal-dependent hydrolase (beta-lactamase superfamily II)